jgi:hypothetical protein
MMWHIVVIVDLTRIQHGFNWIYNYINGHLGFGLVAHVVATLI